MPAILPRILKGKGFRNRMKPKDLGSACIYEHNNNEQILNIFQCSYTKRQLSLCSL